MSIARMRKQCKKRTASRMRKKNRSPASKEPRSSEKDQRRSFCWNPTFQHTWIEQITLDRSMAATDREAASTDHIGSESLWIPRTGRPEEEKR